MENQKTKYVLKIITYKALMAFLYSMGFILPAFADTQILSDASSSMSTNFGSGAIIWGIFLVADFFISLIAYAVTKKPQVFMSVFIILVVLKVFVALVISTYFVG